MNDGGRLWLGLRDDSRAAARRRLSRGTSSSQRAS